MVDICGNQLILGSTVLVLSDNFLKELKVKGNLGQKLLE